MNRCCDLDFSDAASPLTPHRALSGARALPQGESGESAAMSLACGHAVSLPRRVCVRAMRGGGAPKSANLWLRDPCGPQRAPLGAPFAASVRHRAPLSGQGLALKQERNTQVVSQLLAGTRIGPGGSSDTARVPCCGKARRRHTPSRHYERLAMTPSEGRGGRMISATQEAGTMRG